MALKTIVSFGDSFIFGSELQDNADGSRAWPGLIAEELGCQYQTFAIPGCGNDSIAQQVYSYFSNNSTKDTLAVINWTWSMRWDFYLSKSNSWVNLGPTCVPDKIKNQAEPDEAARLIAFYKDYISESTQWNHYRNLQTIYAVQQFLRNNDIKSIETFIDTELFFPNLEKPRVEHYYAIKDPSWPDIADERDLGLLPDHIRQEVDNDYHSDHEADYIKLLRSLTVKPMLYFEGETFLEWSRKHNFEITPPPGNHPLEEAHTAAKNLWINTYAEALGINQ